MIGNRDSKLGCPALRLGLPGHEQGHQDPSVFILGLCALQNAESGKRSQKPPPPIPHCRGGHEGPGGQDVGPLHCALELPQSQGWHVQDAEDGLPK